MFAFDQHFSGQASVSVGTTTAVVTIPLATADVPLSADRWCEVTAQYRLIGTGPNHAAQVIEQVILVKGGTVPAVAGGDTPYNAASSPGPNVSSGYSINGSGDLEITVTAGAGGGAAAVLAFVEVKAAWFGVA